MLYTYILTFLKLNTKALIAQGMFSWVMNYLFFYLFYTIDSELRSSWKILDM